MFKGLSIERRATLMLLLVTVLWGGTFIWMKQALNAAVLHLPAMDPNWCVLFFLLLRFGLAAALLLLFSKKGRAGFRGEPLGYGLLLGGLVWLGFLFQMFGLTEVTPAVSAFLTSLFVPITALIGVLIGTQKVTLYVLSSVGLASFGAGWINGPPQLSYGLGEGLTVFCAFIFAVHIIVTDWVMKRVDPLMLTGPMLMMVALCSALLFGGAVLLVEEEGVIRRLIGLLVHWNFVFPLLCCSIFGSLFCLVAINFYQKEVSPVKAAVVYALEPVWAMVGSLVLGLEGEVSFWLPIGALALLLGNLVMELESLLSRADD